MRKQHETLTTTTGKQAKVYGPNDYGEYVTRFYVNGKHMDASDYFTDDKQDAIDTARYHIREEVRWILKNGVR